MQISPNHISFKGYDAAPLKKVHIEHNCHEKIQDELEEICQKEGIKFSKIHDKLPWAQDDKCIIEKNKKPYLIGCDEISNNLLSSFKFKYKIDGSREYGFTTGGNTFIGKYPNGEKWMLIGEDELNQGLKKEDISKTYQIKKENIFIIPQQSFHLDMFLRPIGFPYILVNDPKIAKKNIETHFKDSPLKKQFLINLLLQEKGCSCEKTIKKLEKFGFKPIRIAGVYGQDINFMNAIVNKHSDNKISYITNSSKCNSKEFCELEKIFEEELRKKIPNIDKVYFVSEKNAQYMISNYTMNSLLFRSGGLHCMILEEPNFEAWT